MKPFALSLAHALVAAGFAASASAAEFPGSTPAETVLQTGPSAAPSYIPEEAALSARRRTAKIVPTFVGFPSLAAQAAFQRAIDIWETKISSPVPIRIRAEFVDLGTPDTLAQGGAADSFICPSGCPVGMLPATYYPIALANKLAGKDNFPGRFDVNNRFNTRIRWHFGTDPAPFDKYDFVTVALHEIGHGLGFVGAGGRFDTTRGTVRTGFPRRPLIYDRFTVNVRNVRLFTLTDPSETLLTLLTNNALFFRLSNGTRYRLWAPAFFGGGSSYVHLDEFGFPPGHANSLMTPLIGKGETIRDPGPATLQILKQMGW